MSWSSGAPMSGSMRLASERRSASVCRGSTLQVCPLRMDPMPGAPRGGSLSRTSAAVKQDACVADAARRGHRSVVSIRGLIDSRGMVRLTAKWPCHFGASIVLDS